MRFRTPLYLITTISIGAAAAAAASGRVHSPYAGWQQRDIKALSQTDIDGLRAGRGMMMALPAELNRYPGPTHVLELADALGLSAGQRRQTETIRAAMQEEAIRIGEALIEKERHLDQLFAAGHADAERLRALVAEIARLRGDLRYTHLATHLSMKSYLTRRQIAAYDRLRGYDGSLPATGGAHGGHGGGAGHGGH